MPKVVIQELENVLLWESLEEMSDRERHVLVRRYGMNSRERATLAELDAELDILDITSTSPARGYASYSVRRSVAFVNLNYDLPPNG